MQNSITPVVLWFIWFSQAMACVMFSIFLATPGERVNSFQNPLGLVFIVIPFALAIGLRIGVMPRIKNQLFRPSLIVIGTALSESILILGIFVIPEFRTISYLLCAVAMLTHLPFSKRSNG